jgi:deoxyadenosine/deoxycytidine kinase
MTVWISGPTGSGKTTLSHLLLAAGYSVVEERLPEQLFRAFALDPIQHCARLQEEILHSRFEAWRALAAHSRVVFDRSIDEDVAVFCRMHHELGFLDDTQYERLQFLALDFRQVMPKPDLILFLSAELRVLEARAKRLAQPAIIVSNLQRQVWLYGEWVGARSEAVLRIDNSDCTREALERFLAGCRLC